MERIATDIYTFSELREEGFTYVDKTDILHTMASGEWGKQFFMARPRRFGKSLAISTLKNLFEGRRDLFAGLAIEPLWDWSKKWPVLHLDMGSAQTETTVELRRRWRKMLENECVRNGIPFRDDDNPATVFEYAINRLASTSPDGRMTLLVDEYDKPLLGHLTTDKADAFRDELNAFYSVIKTLESKQRFTFITGVSKFSKVSIFPDLNNLNDWTMHARVATLFGYTHDEVRKYFPERIHMLAEATGRTDDDAFAEIIRWYDGYRFEECAEPVINPVSLSWCLNSNKFANYWSKTAVPTFLVNMLKERPLNFSCVNVDESDLESYEPSNPKLVTLLFQTGYLTIKDFEQIGGMRRYGLRFPNLEVENSFIALLAGTYTPLCVSVINT